LLFLEQSLGDGTEVCRVNFSNGPRLTAGGNSLRQTIRIGAKRFGWSGVVVSHD
jgi:hypothetical protein